MSKRSAACALFAGLAVLAVTVFRPKKSTVDSLDLYNFSFCLLEFVAVCAACGGTVNGAKRIGVENEFLNIGQWTAHGN